MNVCMQALLRSLSSCARVLVPAPCLLAGWPAGERSIAWGCARRLQLDLEYVGSCLSELSFGEEAVRSWMRDQLPRAVLGYRSASGVSGPVIAAATAAASGVAAGRVGRPGTTTGTLPGTGVGVGKPGGSSVDGEGAEALGRADELPTPLGVWRRRPLLTGRGWDVGELSGLDEPDLGERVVSAAAAVRRSWFSCLHALVPSLRWGDVGHAGEHD